MRNFTRYVAALTVLSLLLISGGCNSESDEAATRITVSIASGGTGGAYYPLGGGVAEILNDNVEGMRATAEVTGAAVENMRLLATGEAEIGIMDASISFMAATGQPPFESQIEVMSLGNISFSVGHYVALADTGMEKMTDLRGSRLAVGAPGSGTEAVTEVALALHGITYDDIDVHHLTFAEAVVAMKDGHIDAATVSSAVPNISILELTATHEIAFLEVQEEEKLLEALPFLIPWTIPAGTYQGIDHNVSTFASASFVAVMPDFDEDLAYQVTRAIYENLEFLHTVHVSAADLDLERAVIVPAGVKLHPGAERYFREAGVLP